MYDIMEPYKKLSIFIYTLDYLLYITVKLDIKIEQVVMIAYMILGKSNDVYGKS